MDGVLDCFDKVLKGEILLVILRNTMFEEVELRTLESADKFRKLMMRKGINYWNKLQQMYLHEYKLPVLE